MNNTRQNVTWSSMAKPKISPQKSIVKQYQMGQENIKVENCTTLILARGIPPDGINTESRKERIRKQKVP